MIGRRRKPQPELAPAPAVAPAAPPSVLSPAERALQVEAELHEARSDVLAARSELEAARGAYRTAVDDADIAAATAARARGSMAETAVDIAEGIVGRLGAELARLLGEVSTAAELAERERLREVAEVALAAYKAIFEEKMPYIVREFHNILRVWAEAELAREAAGAVGITLPHADHFRDQEGTPRIEAGVRELDLWLNPWGNQPFDDDRQRQVKVRSDGSGALNLGNHTESLYNKRRYQEVQFYPLVPGRRALSLAEGFAIPALTANDAPAWVNPEGRGSVSPRTVLRLLDQHAAPRPVPTEPQLRTERRPLEAAREVAVKREVPRIGAHRSV